MSRFYHEPPSRPDHLSPRGSIGVSSVPGANYTPMFKKKVKNKIK